MLVAWSVPGRSVIIIKEAVALLFHAHPIEHLVALTCNQMLKTVYCSCEILGAKHSPKNFYLSVRPLALLIALLGALLIALLGALLMVSSEFKERRDCCW